MAAALDNHIGTWTSPFMQATAALPFVGPVVSFIALNNLEKARNLAKDEENYRLNISKVIDFSMRYMAAGAISKISTAALLIGMIALNILQSSFLPILFVTGSLLWAGYDWVRFEQYAEVKNEFNL